MTSFRAPVFALVSLLSTAAGQTQTLDPKGHPDLYEIRLVPAPKFRQVTGRARLVWASTPFGTAVTKDGHLEFDLDIEIESLPEPTSLGDYDRYVAWVTTPILRPMHRLGSVKEGLNVRVGTVALNKFILMISAEKGGDSEERSGPLVLRGMSPSTRLLPDNHLMVPAVAASDNLSGDHASHSGGSTDEAPNESDVEWFHPPMHPLVSMIPGLEDLSPSVDAFLPRPLRGQVLPVARPSEVVRLQDGQTLDLVAEPVRRTIQGHDYVMYGFNGQYPGPLIEVDQNTTITVFFTNKTEWPTAVHWHGVRLDNRYDGVPGITQDPVPPDGHFEYRVTFPDAGIYWYHPHHREDVQQDLGLYGNLRVRAADSDFFNPVHREEVLMLDDIAIADGHLLPFGKDQATHALMGRFGNVLLVNGEPRYTLELKRGELVRFFLTNASNTRTFNMSFGELPVKVIASDLSKFEKEVWTDSVVIGPAERYVVEVLFPESGDIPVSNRVQILDHAFGSFGPEVSELGIIRVDTTAASPNREDEHLKLEEHPEVSREIRKAVEETNLEPDLELLLTLELNGLPPKLMSRMRAEQVYFPPMEWSGTMPMMNWVSTSKEVRWILREPSTGRENMDIEWQFRVGDLVRIRLFNDREAIHAMQHPFHIHGQRFAVISRNGQENENLVWKDTVLVPVGDSVDLLLELSNPGRWMAHCHIAEHLETGMKLVFNVLVNR